MPRRNRVGPFGDLHAVPERGMFTGNRGCVVDDHGNVVRHHGASLWIICRLRYRDWRYIRYENGKEELYHTAADPHEWTNLAGNGAHAAKLEACREDLLARLPESIPAPKADAGEWKDRYFKKHPEADTNQDGELSWPELKAHKG